MFLRLITVSLFSCLILVACSNMTLSVQSEPEKATVFLKDGIKLKKLGETPLRLTSDELGRGANYSLVIKKEGFQTEQVLIEKRTLKAKAEVFASLQRSSENGRGLASEQGGDVEEQQRSLASIQSQLIQNNYKQAEILARSFVDQNPYSAVGWNLLANSYLLQNRNQQALQAYLKAYEFDPNNQDTKKMIEHLGATPPRRER